MKNLTSNLKPIDDGAWEEALKGVKKLPQKEVPPEAPLIIDDIEPTVNYAKAYSGASLKPLGVGETDNIDRRTAEKFKRGEFPIQRTLDLHGLTEKDAFDAVEAFIKNVYLDGLRCVLIITGKGTLREDDDWFERKGILKDRVPQWLNTPELRPLILSFSQALPADGGEGALYVLLRRHRNG